MRALLITVLAASSFIGARASAQDGGAADAGVLDPSVLDTIALDAGVVDTDALDGSVPDRVDASIEDQNVPDALAAALPDGGPAAIDAGRSPGDAGVAGPPDVNGGGGWYDVLNGLIWERTEEAERAAQRANERLDRRETSEAGEGHAVVPVRVVEEAPVTLTHDVPVRVVGCEPGMLGFDLPERKVSTPALLFLIAIALLAIWLLDRARKPLPERGFVPRVLSIAHLAARVSAVVMVLMIATRLLPGWLRPALLFSIGAAALVIGAGSVWVVLPDLVGGLLLVTEGRLRPGMWVVGDGFAGTVERVGPRLTTLRAPDGAKLTIPNRRLVKSPILASDRRWHEVEVSLTVPSGHDAPKVRRAVEDAVLCSPFVPPEPALEVTRDPDSPLRWRVKARVLDTTYADRFEGQLLERVEEALDLEE